jgi:hypothetical protein
VGNNAGRSVITPWKANDDGSRVHRVARRQQARQDYWGKWRGAGGGGGGGRVNGMVARREAASKVGGRSAGGDESIEGSRRRVKAAENVDEWKRRTKDDWGKEGRMEWNEWKDECGWMIWKEELGVGGRWKNFALLRKRPERNLLGLRRSMGKKKRNMMVVEEMEWPQVCCTKSGCHNFSSFSFSRSSFPFLSFGFPFGFCKEPLSKKELVAFQRLFFDAVKKHV